MGSGSNRNQLCTCGSGKKFKNCCIEKRKARTIEIHFDPVNYALLDRMEISQEGRIIGVKNDLPIPILGTVSIEQKYKRSKKDKILSIGTIDPTNIYINPALIITKYDHVFGIDTNTQNLEEDRISVACVIHCIIEPQIDMFSLRYSVIGLYEFWNIQGKTENLVWSEIIAAIENDENFKNKKIGVLVDSDLGNHESFNNRELPIFDDFYLPDSFELFYSSSDVGMENITNRLIKHCDKLAKQHLDWIIEQKNIENLMPVEDRPYTHFRIWSPRNDMNLELNTDGLDGIILK